MLNGKALIVIAQKHGRVLRSIENFARVRCSDGESNDVRYLSHSGHVLKVVQAEPVDMIITGDYFPKRDSYFRHIDDEGISHEAMVLSASSMAKMARMIRPDVMVLRYSSAPREEHDSLDGIAGDIDKDDTIEGVKVICSMIGSEELPRILQTRDWARLRDEFPKITFYDTLDTYR